MTRHARIPAVGAPVDPRATAYAALVELGHKPLSDREDYQCWHCDLRGRLKGAVMSGEIFEEKCNG